MKTTPATELKIGDTFRFNLIGSKWFTVKGFRGYKNAKFPEHEHNGLTKSANVTDERGISMVLTIFPDQQLIIMGRGELI